MKKITYILITLILLTGCSNNDKPIEQSVQPEQPQEQHYNSNDSSISSEFDESKYTIIEVGACELSGDRKPNVKVDIGFGDKVYWAYTNEYRQLVRITADEIFLQDEVNEPVLENGRYCKDEAKVPGTEEKELDEGHGIADSLSGTSNAYNITPQNSTLNRHGDQAYMEDQMRKALQAGLKVTDFEAIITYPNTETQIPSYYKYTYKIDGNVVVDEFPNVDPNTVPVEEEIAVPDFSDEEKYVLNVNSKKIHTPDCEAVGKMSEKNKEEYVGDVNDLLNQGYELCGICNPK